MLDQRHFDLWLYFQHGGEADLRGVASSTISRSSTTTRQVRSLLIRDPQDYLPAPVAGVEPLVGLADLFQGQHLGDERS
jgi:hypothetical protein